MTTKQDILVATAATIFALAFAIGFTNGHTKDQSRISHGQSTIEKVSACSPR